jgi:dTDP-glucose 4,6-dehydratase
MRLQSDLNSRRKVTQGIGLEATHGLQISLEKTVQWYLDNLTWVNSVTSGDYKNFDELWYKDP